MKTQKPMIEKACISFLNPCHLDLSAMESKTQQWNSEVFLNFGIWVFSESGLQTQDNFLGEFKEEEKMPTKRLRDFYRREAVEFLNHVMVDRPLLPFLIPLVLVVWALERWLVLFSNWVPLFVAVWAMIQNGKFQVGILVEDLNKKWTRLILNTLSVTAWEPCEWLNKLLMEVWPNFIEPKLSKRFSATVEMAPILLFASQYDHLITLWRLSAIVDGLRCRLLEAWAASSHRKIVALSVATVFWNLFAVKMCRHKELPCESKRGCS